MAVAVTTCILLGVYIISCARNAAAASVGWSYANEAEKYLNELSKTISNIKNALRPRHCNDLLHAGQRPSGLYTIFPLVTEVDGQIVHCDMDTDGGGWTVIQRRGQFGNNAYYFYRNWTEYATGFGDPNKEYWIGNRALHALTSEVNDTALRIVLTNGTGESVSFDYGSFHVGSEQQLFKLNIGKYVGPEGWDSMSTAQDCSFSTHDRDNDRGSASCAVEFHGAWWYSDCFHANLNGLNLNGYHDSFADGIEWLLRGGPDIFAHYSYPEVLMMIRMD